MKHLDQLLRKCRHDPKMGGNTETITLPCTLVARLIGLAQGWERPDGSRGPIREAVEQELVWADDEAKVWLEENYLRHLHPDTQAGGGQ